jgi:ABC-type multidrug transport system fused ATPase/permease subunit
MNLLKRLPFFGITFSRAIILIILTIVAALFEGFGMTMLLPVLEFIEKGKDVILLEGESGMWQKIISIFNYIGIRLNLINILFAVMSVMIVRVLTVYIRQIYNAWLSQEVLHTIRSKLYESYMNMKYGVYTDISSGATINLLTTEANRAGGSLQALFGLLSNITVLVALSGVLIWISFPLTILSLIIFGIAALVVSYNLRYTRIYSHKTSEANTRYSHKIIESLGAFRLIKLTATEKRVLKNVNNASEEVRDLNYHLSKLIANVDFIMEPFVIFAGCTTIYLSINVLEMDIAQISIFGLIMLRMLPIAKEAMKSRQSFNANFGSLSVVINGYDMALAAMEKKGGDKTFNGLSKGIRLDHISFSYKKSDQAVLSDITLTIPAGKITAIVGPSGAGKSTLVDIIARLHLPIKGRIFYDENEESGYALGSLRRGISFVSQDVTILDDTVAENVRFARYKASEEEILEALEQAKAHEFVKLLPDGLNTSLGERGVKLSGGQKQRLSLARALLQKARVLILDEPTSALDSETERDIKQVIDDLRVQGETTIIIIAHRLSTIVDADNIIVLDNGHILEQGSHKELANSDEWYANISSMQSIDIEKKYN